MIPSDLFDEPLTETRAPGNVRFVSEYFRMSDYILTNQPENKRMLAIQTQQPFVAIEPASELDERFEFVSRIGQGAFGTVSEYLDRRNKFERVAIKATPDAERESYEQEVKILSELNKTTPYVTTLKDTFEENGFCYLVMRRADRTLGRFIHENAPVDLSMCIHIAHQIALGLEGLHALGYTHTDLKPDNVVIYNDLRVQIIDFGCCMKSTELNPAVPTDSEGNLYLTTRWYRAPEVVLATKDYLSPRMDMWALGCILVEMLTGFVLFPSVDEEDLLAMIEIFLGPVPNNVLMTSDNTRFLYARRADTSVRPIPDLKKPNAHKRTRWMKYTKMCWTNRTDAFDMSSDFVLFARMDQSHVFDGIEIPYFHRTINWAAYLNMLYSTLDTHEAVKLRRVIRSCLVIDPGMRANSDTIVHMLEAST
jgi:serine/threonine protein kinase